ncbi:MAG: hypothetical protein LAT80_11765 [Balneolaceae bacterium]|nr:hypothetical protein [Balneolaceae bacterium]
MYHQQGPKPTFDIAYNIWTLLGESVWSFVAKYNMPDRIVVIRDGETALEIRKGRGNTRTLPYGGYHRVVVSPDVYEKIRITSFRFSATISAWTGQSFGTTMIMARNPGITGAQGEWGWDVPANPTWDKMFLKFDTGSQRIQSTFQNFKSIERANIPEEAWLNSDEARDLFLEYKGKRNVLTPGDIWDIKMDIGPVIREIRRATPEALEHYYSRPRDSQALAMISALERSDLPRNSRAYQEQVETVRNALQRFGNDVSPELINDLEIVGAGANHDRLASNVRQVGNMVQSILSNTPNDEAPNWPDALKTRIQQLFDSANDVELPPQSAIWTQLANLHNIVIGMDDGINVEREYSLEVCDTWSVSNSGGAQGTLDRWDISAIPEGAVFDIRYDARSVPDRYEVDYPLGNRVLDTGWRGSQRYAGSRYPGGIRGQGRGTSSDIFQKRGVNQFVVRVFGGASGTLWDYQIRCRIPE